MKNQDTNLKEYVEKNKEELSRRFWNILIKILNDRNDGFKYELEAKE